MSEIRDVGPEDAAELTALSRDYEWWADREGGDVRDALSETEVAVGVEEDGTLVAAARVLTDYTHSRICKPTLARPHGTVRSDE